jgi:hypothetical protein
MANKTSRKSIEKRIGKSLQCYIEGDVEDAVFNIAPAIDVVAKARYPEKKQVGDRIKAFLFDEQSMIYYLSSQGNLDFKDGVIIKLVDCDNANKPVGNIGGELADFIYHNLRCAQTHDAEIDYSVIDFGRNFGICRYTFEGDGGPLAPGLFVISNATVLALILAVICAPENKNLRLKGHLSLYGRVQLDRDELVGNKKYLMNKLNELFRG